MKHLSMLIVAALMCGSSAFAADTAAVSGRVYDAASSSPVAGASIIVQSPTSAKTIAKTDKNGRFEVLGIVPGQVLVVVEAPGLFPASLPMCARAGGLQSLDVPMYERGNLMLSNVYNSIGAHASSALADANPFVRYIASSTC